MLFFLLHFSINLEDLPTVGYFLQFFFTQVEILHGKGTGALKKTAHEILNQHDKVKNYYFAKIELGGEGITIVEFKN